MLAGQVILVTLARQVILITLAGQVIPGLEHVLAGKVLLVKQVISVKIFLASILKYTA